MKLTYSSNHFIKNYYNGQLLYFPHNFTKMLKKDNKNKKKQLFSNYIF